MLHGILVFHEMSLYYVEKGNVHELMSFFVAANQGEEKQGFRYHSAPLTLR